MAEIKCAYDCEFHRGKIDWHHPISTNGMIGLHLCESHHSVIMGRKIKYSGETIINKTLAEMRIELKALERKAVIEQGGNPDDIDKH